MRRLTTILGATVIALAMAVPASAAPEKSQGRDGNCVSNGLKTLNSLGLTSTVARDGLPEGLGFGNLSLSETIGAHLDSPGLFAWCGNGED